MAEDLQTWILVVSGTVSMLSVAVGIWLSLRDYRLKLQAEQRQHASAQIEAEIRLNTLFAELMQTANGRSGYVVSEKIVEFVLERLQKVDIFAENGRTIRSDQLDAINTAVELAAIVTLPVGSGAQDASLAAITSLARKHPELQSAALAGLERLAEPLVSPSLMRYLTELRDMTGAQVGDAGRVTGLRPTDEHVSLPGEGETVDAGETRTSASQAARVGG